MRVLLLYPVVLLYHVTLLVLLFPVALLVTFFFCAVIMRGQLTRQAVRIID